MNIIERGRAFREQVRALAGRSRWDWRRCPRCGQTDTWRHGKSTRHPWTLRGRQTLTVQRHWCRRCQASYSEASALLGRGRWYAREVERFAIDHCQHVGSSVRRTAELLRSLLGRQERWLRWQPLADTPPADQRCRLGASTVQRWVDAAGQRAQQTVPDQLTGVPSSGQLGTDGLWARLTKGATRVVLLLTDSVSGLVYPPVVVAGEREAADWAPLFDRAATAGLDLDAVRGLTSDGARGIAAYLDTVLTWVNQQRCQFHLWRNLSGAFANAAQTAAAGLAGAAATAVRRATRQALVGLVRAVLDAPSYDAAVAALAPLAAHPRGGPLATALRDDLDAALVYRLPYHRGLVRVGPEWCWRDFRLRLSRGRNHRTDDRLERAALVWAIYRNFEPAQVRCERNRRYRRSGHSPLALAGVPPGAVSYLDALAV